MRVTLIGSKGQLGTDLARVLGEHVDLRLLTHAEIDITEPRSIDLALASDPADLVINTAAFNRVDDCEVQLEEAIRVNAIGPHLLGRACQRLGMRMLQISTDYVFSGDLARPWSEDDWPQPASAYGISKLAGEMAVRTACPSSYVARVSGLYGLAGSRGKGGNFVETMLRLQASGRTIRVVDDQVLTPTSTLDVARKLTELILREPPAGIYHVTAAGDCSWYEFARAVFALSHLEVDLRPQSSAEFAAPARRPTYSVLANDALRSIGITQIRPWAEGLGEYLAQRPTIGQVATAMAGV